MIFEIRKKQTECFNKNQSMLKAKMSDSIMHEMKLNLILKHSFLIFNVTEINSVCFINKRNKIFQLSFKIQIMIKNSLFLSEKNAFNIFIFILFLLQHTQISNIFPFIDNIRISVRNFNRLRQGHKNNSNT